MTDPVRGKDASSENTAESAAKHLESIVSATEAQHVMVNAQAYAMKRAAEHVAVTETVDTAIVGGAATSSDGLGFGVYVDALAKFLTSPNTRPPLTISVEGEWGSGKSSFMLQLQERIRASAGESYIVEFNAWRYEKQEALWAAFALTFIRAMGRQIGFLDRCRAGLTLILKRVDRDQGIYRLLWTLFYLIAVIAIAIGSFVLTTQKLNLERLEPGWWASVVALVTFVVSAVRVAYEKLGSPLERDLKKYFDAPDYRGNRAFVESFTDDFAKIVAAYVRKSDARIFVFIDDLDRCEVSRAADLLQALNLMLPAEEDSPLIYILGFDREMVCTGIAANFEKQIPYLYPTITDPTLRQFAALELARSYLDKFVQLPFGIPVPAADSVQQYVDMMTSAPDEQRVAARTDDAVRRGPSKARQTTAEKPKVDSDDWAVQIEAGPESASVRHYIAMVAPFLGNNPRRLKQFVNVFRLQACIAGESALFRSHGSRAKDLTLPKLAKLTAMFLRHPELATVLRGRPELLADLQRRALTPDAAPVNEEDQALRYYLTRNPLMKLLEQNGTSDDYRLDELDLSGILTTVPAQPRAGINRLAQTMARANEQMFSDWDKIADGA